MNLEKTKDLKPQAGLGERVTNHGADNPVSRDLASTGVRRRSGDKHGSGASGDTDNGLGSESTATMAASVPVLDGHLIVVTAAEETSIG